MSSPKPLRVLMIRHEDPTPGGLITRWLQERGAEIEELRIDLDDRAVDPRPFQVLVSLGSEFAAFDDSVPFVQREIELLRQAVDADVPVLGVCFGGQLLARTLGGEGFRAPDSEIGWLPVRSLDPELVPEGPWFQWHFDSFSLPRGAVLVADSDAGPQAFVVGRSIGLQFHPEITPEIMEVWVREYRHELDAEKVDPDALLAETYRRAEASSRMAWRLLTRYFATVAHLGEEAVHGR